MKRLITIFAAALVLASCGASHKKVHSDDPWPEFSYEKVDTYSKGKIVEVEYACFIGVGSAPTQYFAEMQAESDAQARMAKAVGGDVRLKGVTRVGQSIIKFDEHTRMYTVYVRMGVPASVWDTYRYK